MKQYKMILLMLTLLTTVMLLPSKAENLTIQEEKATLYQDGIVSVDKVDLSLLDATTSEQLAYDRIYRALLNRETEIALSDLNIQNKDTNISAIYRQVINENPELYYVKSEFQVQSINTVIYCIRPQYNTATETEDEKFKNRVNEILNTVIQPNMGDLEKVLAIHDELVLSIAYNKQVSEGKPAPSDSVYSAYGALVNRDAVCQGYALAFQLLMNRLDIPCQTVSSKAMNHIWNVVQLDGSWYHIDATWDDPVPNCEGMCRYNYFMRTDAEMKDANTGKHYNWSTQAPVCTSTKYSTGYAFRDAQYAFHWVDGAFYYLKERGNGTTLMKGKLNETGQVITELSMNWYSGIAWDQEYLYYFSDPIQLFAETMEPESAWLCRYSLKNKRVEQINQFQFERIMDGNSTNDCIGMNFDPTKGSISAISSKQEKIYMTETIDSNKSYPDVTPFPSGWKQYAHGIETVGMQKEADGIYVGIISNTVISKKPLYFAFYQGGQMIAIQNMEVNLKNGPQWVALKSGIPAQYDAVKVILLDNSISLKPLCPMLSR